MKKIIVILFSIIISVSAFSQKKVVEYLQQVDNKPIHFGFVLGLHTQSFQVTPSEIPDENGVVWYSDNPSPSPGFTVGIVTDMRMGEYFNLRFIPTLNFGDRTMSFAGYYQDVKVESFSTNVFSSLINMPFYIKYRAARLNNHRPYLLFGAGASMDLSRKKDLTLLLKPFDGFIEFGVGCDFYLPYFKLAPELKFCLGLSDMLERNRPLIINEDELKYTNSIARLGSRIITLSFNFE